MKLNENLADNSFLHSISFNRKKQAKTQAADLRRTMTSSLRGAFEATHDEFLWHFGKTIFGIEHGQKTMADALEIVRTFKKEHPDMRFVVDISETINELEQALEHLATSKS